MRASIFGLPTKCTFSSMARAAECGYRQKSRTPFYSSAPTRKSVGYFGAVRLRDGRFVFRLEIGKFNGPVSFSFCSNSARPVVGREDALWSLATMPLITTRDSTSRGGSSRPTVLPWTSFRLLAPNLIRSSECGSSHCLHNRYFENLKDIITAVEAEFATWTTRNDVLRRLCAIT